MLNNLPSLTIFRVDLMQNSLILTSGVFALTAAVVMSGRNLHHLKVRCENWRECYPSFINFLMEVKNAARLVSLQEIAIR